MIRPILLDGCGSVKSCRMISSSGIVVVVVINDIRIHFDRPKDGQYIAAVQLVVPQSIPIQ